MVSVKFIIHIYFLVQNIEYQEKLYGNSIIKTQK